MINLQSRIKAKAESESKPEHEQGTACVCVCACVRVALTYNLSVHGSCLAHVFHLIHFLASRSHSIASQHLTHHPSQSTASHRSRKPRPTLPTSLQIANRLHLQHQPSTHVHSTARLVRLICSFKFEISSLYQAHIHRGLVLHDAINTMTLSA